MSGTAKTAEWVDVAGKVLFAEVCGGGDATLLLIHEMGGTLHSWDRLVPLLQPFFRVVRYDVHGNGRSEAIRGPMNFRTAVQDAALLLERLGIEGPIIPIGCAVGGAIALGFAAAYPALCPAVVALAPSTSIPLARRAAAFARADKVEAEGLRTSIDESLMRSYPPILRTDRALFEQGRTMRLAANPRGFGAMMRMLIGLDMTSDFAALRCPALVLAGEYDQDRPPEHVATVAAAIRFAVFDVIPSGHFMAWQTPDLVASKVMSFLKQNIQYLPPQH
ncbi:alpha/beta fold hydrolase [Acidisoma cellulosilytica]|uniref:Alpha/beta fold hydrolase n=1 Tax=Acidisoma cellulosilyticum TaxID=2802395 RepID=A0A963Z748_9PROT|nr:alpha/beta hydrolase [Acidisoma cellulosilyticum]MCB8883092.1 alpha/beta fold hydrolase [Acidisoma cellulosilyticum]